ncbi:stalk domain-containing protein [Paenibacillus sp. GCM10027626]|uniref:stalk domain-containing protein n=1 Tax=Paenibacillus sp. GCM10027626 TaxID=3273411 RepID=UPI00363A5C91
MKQHRRRYVLAGLSFAVTASLLASSVSAAPPATSPWDNKEDGMTWEQFMRNNIIVYFDNLNVSLQHMQPKAINNVVMVPGAALLEGLGYSIQWDAKAGKLSANHPNSAKPSQTYWAKQHKAQIANQVKTGLPTAPYIDQDTLWIPLRLAAESAGLKVKWTAGSNTVIITDPQALTRISVVTRADNNVEAPPAKLQDYMREHWKVNASLSPVKTDYYREKTNILIAAGEPVSLMLLHQSHLFNQELFESIAIDLEESLQAFPRLKALAASGGRTINGHAFTIPRPADKHDAPFLALRQDWLDILGLAQPKTMDELYIVLDQFVHKDPDGNGKMDTYGLAGYNGSDAVAWIEQAFTGSPERFAVQNGKVTDHAIGMQQQQALEWLNKAYAKGLIHPDFNELSADEINQLIANNQIGIATMTFDKAVELSTEGKTQWTPLAGFRANGASQEIAPWRNTGEDSYFITRLSRVKPEELLKWLDRGIAMTEAGEWDNIAGLEEADRSAIRNLFGRTDLLKGNAALDALPEQKRQGFESAVKQWRTVENDIQPLPQANALWSSGKYAKLNEDLHNMKADVIRGKATIADWTAFISKMTASKEYKEMMKELNALASLNK